MKNIIVYILLLTSITSSAQNDAAEDTITKPAITAIGKPDGINAEMKISKDGGSLSSSDGKVVLIIPEGAVSKKTTFSIQPVTNMVPNGNGKAYSLEPSGIQFKKPVQLVFHYDEEEIKDTMQLLLGIAMQGDKGQWFGLKKFTLDTIAKTISGNINHFSVWATFNELQLISVPDKNRLKVKNSLLLIISGVTPGASDESNDELAPLDNWKAPKKTIWRVNGIIKGNALFGKLSEGNMDESKPAVNNYIAPDNVPDQNPVAISVDLEGASVTVKGIKIPFKKLRLVKNILIYDNAYEVTMISSINGSAGTVFGNANYKDTGSFVISINGKDTKIIEKVNKNADAELDYKGKCIITPLKPGSGNVHIIGARSIKVIPAASPAQNATIVIEFIHAPTKPPLLQYKCPPVGKGDWTTDNNAKANAMIFMIPAYPQVIKFEAKEGLQFIEQIGGPGQDIFYQVLVRRLKDD